MRNTTILNSSMTLTKYGYAGTELPEGSHKLVVAECLGCKRLIDKEFRNLNRLHTCPSVEGNLKRCYKCTLWKDLSLFNKASRKHGKVAKLCRECYNKHDAVKKCEYNRGIKRKAAFSEDIEYYMQTRFNSLKTGCKSRGILFSLSSYQVLLDLWNKQKGKCFYSNLQMKSEGRVQGFQGWYAPSLDRKDPSKGYTEDNIVWCCFAVNSFKLTMNSEDFLKLVSSIEWNL